MDCSDQQKHTSVSTDEEGVEELIKDLGSSAISDAKNSDSINNTEGCEPSCSTLPGAHNADDHTPENFDKESDDDKDEGDWDDVIDEVALKDAELSYTDEDRQRLRTEAESMKKEGNQQFKDGNYRESAITYTLALRTCPLAYDTDRAILYSNRAASKMKLGLLKSAIEDCCKALELNPQYVRALWRRAQLYEETEKLDEALEDCKKILEIDPSHTEANYAVRKLPDQISERNEKLKTEMMSKLKDLGNLFLRPFGLSTENFQLNQDPDSGGYSINFKQS